MDKASDGDNDDVMTALVKPGQPGCKGNTRRSFARRIVRACLFGLVLFASITILVRHLGGLGFLVSTCLDSLIYFIYSYSFRTYLPTSYIESPLPPPNMPFFIRLYISILPYLLSTS